MEVSDREKKFFSFDFDGTLAYFLQLVESLKFAVDRTGLPIEPLEQYLARLRQGARLPLDLENAPLIAWPELQKNPARHQFFINVFTEVELESEYKAIEGSIEILERLLSRGKFLFLFTANRLLTLEKKMSSAGFRRSHFHRLITNDGVYVKPRREAIMPTLEHFGLRPEEGCHIGDSITDIEAARSAGMGFFGVLTGALDREGFWRHDIEDERILESVADFPEAA